MLMLRRQLQRLAQMRGVLVAVETGLVGRDLEQHAAGRAEIDRPEIVAIDDRRDLVASVHQRLAHLELLFAVLDGEGDMVDRSRAEIGKAGIRQRLDVDDVGAVAALHGQPARVAGTIDFLVAHELQQFLGRSGVPETQRDGMETAQRLVRRNAALDPRSA